MKHLPGGMAVVLVVKRNSLRAFGSSSAHSDFDHCLVHHSRSDVEVSPTDAPEGSPAFSRECEFASLMNSRRTLRIAPRRLIAPRPLACRAISRFVLGLAIRSNLLLLL